jgi:glutamate synthase (NADPH/NADH) large chain
MVNQSLERQKAEKFGLYDSSLEHDACGIGLVASVKGQASHEIISEALQILKNLDHRGAVGADPLCGDGSGILIQIPDQFLRSEMAKQNVMLPQPGDYGVGMVFLPREPASRRACEQELERTIREEGQVLLGWRDVPVNTRIPVSKTVLQTAPVIRQVFIGRGSDVMVPDALERKLFVIRKYSGHRIQALHLKHGKEFYVPSMSTKTIVYKGLLLADQLGAYYCDLTDPRVVSAIALVHQRFSTNTFPSWELAHPFRIVAHNGEINTVNGNFNWLRARERTVTSSVLNDDVKKLLPIIYEGQSDTACLDNMLELLIMSGYPLAQAVMMVIPEAWEQSENMDPARRAFYEYYGAMLEPWDGPAAVGFTDGVRVGALLDRNGLRPARYLLTNDDIVILASEAGVLPIPESRIKRKCRLEPGKMLLIDTEQGRLVPDEEIKRSFALSKPYKEWTKRLNIHLSNVVAPYQAPQANPVPLIRRQNAFGYVEDDIKFILKPMAEKGQEATSSMGNDTPLAMLSHRSKPFYNYFRQRFAQVTNPPIDPIREQLVMSLISFVGPRPNLLDINNVNPPLRLELTQPILGFDEIAKLRTIENHTQGKFKSFEIDTTYRADWGAEGVEARLASLCATAADAVKEGYNILILTDRKMNEERVAIPAPLAVSTIHQHLIRTGLRTNTGIVVETGSALQTHHMAVLAAYGAEAIHPYLALETLRDLYRSGNASGIEPDAAMQNYIKAIGKSFKKIMSKMGISTYMSYRGAQIFEALGLEEGFVKRYFPGTSSKVGGLNIFEVMQEAVDQHKAAFHPEALKGKLLPTEGEYQWRAQGEEHMWTPQAIAHLQHATRSNSYQTYKQYAEIINDQSERQMTLRGLMEFNVNPSAAIPLEEVEPAAQIVKRFATGAMSMGSISAEAHATLAVAMNRIGGKSNTGEGGEDPKRYVDEMRTGKSSIQSGDTLKSVLGEERIVGDVPLEAGDSLRSKIKQVASGRFGVTEEYLLSADQIQIKMAQGAKPGEGGQLPGHKVSEYIAKLRYSVPGVGLISPPPHHDIYSIEDLAQLIHDLKMANTKADISVKLVSEQGVGTVAAGVAKAKADHIVISGHDGGTGASPLSSIKFAGTPWEQGLSETQQTLVINQLRDRVCVQVDGQIKTGRDVVIGALLGADEFGFATAPLVVEGCLMMRKCHLNTCPVGIATQDPVLRKRFKGQPKHVVNYFFFVAEEVREIMASLGVRKFEDLIGRVDLLRPKEAPLAKCGRVDLSKVLYQPAVENASQRRHSAVQVHALEKELDMQLVQHCEAALTKQERVSFISPIRNIHRTVGTYLSSEVVRRFGAEGLPEDTIHIQFTGTAGQSFGAFLANGITVDLVGAANDYVGKGLSGGKIIVRCPTDFRGKGEENIIAGNTVLYGATSGEAYFNGVTGERFAVRLSGAKAVCEGVGDHGCEYMTGGTVVILGAVGRNFAAGMSGGIAFVYDPDSEFSRRCNLESVELVRVPESNEQMSAGDRSTWHLGRTDEELLLELIENHFRYTGSQRAREILDDWAHARQRFVKVFPKEYKQALLKGLATTAA